MKVLDPQSALLTNAEVHHFLKTTKTRPPDKSIGAYGPINLKDYHNVKQDFDRYITLTSPHISAYPTPETYMDNVINRLRQFDLTKTEALMILNLGIGLDRPAFPEQPSATVPEPATTKPQAAEEDEDEGDGNAMSPEPKPAPNADDTRVPAPETSDEAAVAAADVQISETYHQYTLARVVENIEERFPGEEGEKKIEELLGVLRECIPLNGGQGEVGSKKGANGD